MNIQEESEWKTFYSEGKSYMEIVESASQKESKFTPEILYNIACMSIEKLFMSYFLKSGRMPSNHTLLDLVESIKEIDKIPEDLETRLLHMNNFQEICTIEQYQRKIPSKNDINDFLSTLRYTKKYIDSLLN